MHIYFFRYEKMEGSAGIYGEEVWLNQEVMSC